MKKYKISCSVICTLFFFFSCNKQLEITPISNISDANYWQTPEQVDAFVSGIHIAFRSTTSALQFLGEMRSDIFGTEPGAGSSFSGESTGGLERLWTNNLNIDNAGVNNYGNFYFVINQINLLSHKLNELDFLGESTRNYYAGICYGMRAFLYYQLIRSWGKVIIQTEPTMNIDIANLNKPASNEDSVMALIKSDIDRSLTSFGNDYSFKNQKGFWSKAATSMLKAEVYLWTAYRGGGNADALVAKNALIEIQTGVPSLALLSSYAGIFASNNKGNNEIIFSIRNRLDEATLPFSPTFLPQTGLLANFYDSLGNRKFNINTDNWGGVLRVPVRSATYRKFSDRDSRKWLSLQGAYNLVAGKYQLAGVFANKYQGEQNAGLRQMTNDFPIYRYADLLLLLAEAKILLGESPANEINLVRARAYGVNYAEASLGYPNQAIDVDPENALLQERFFEFVFEGKRWYDLRRMGDQFVFNNTSIKSSETYKLLWPIDRNTLTNNRALEQTPGYSQF